MPRCIQPIPALCSYGLVGMHVSGFNQASKFEVRGVVALHWQACKCGGRGSGQNSTFRIGSNHRHENKPSEMVARRFLTFLH